jgi:hypothetical protein
MENQNIQNQSSYNNGMTNVQPLSTNTSQIFTQTQKTKGSNRTLFIVLGVIAVMLILCILCGVIAVVSGLPELAREIVTQTLNNGSQNGNQTSNNGSQNGNQTSNNDSENGNQTSNNDSENGNQTLNNGSQNGNQNGKENMQTPGGTDISDAFFPNGPQYQPVSKSFSEYVLSRSSKRALLATDGYGNNIGSVGRPAYSFSNLYGLGWKTIKFELNKFIVESPDGRTRTGVLYFDKNSVEYNLSCTEIVKRIFEEPNLVTESRTVMVNGNQWNRVIYKSRKNLSGIDQCLKKEEGLLLHFIVSDSNIFSQKSEEYTKVMDDIYVSMKALNY